MVNYDAITVQAGFLDTELELVALAIFSCNAMISAL